jgi:hypothetical protein
VVDLRLGVTGIDESRDSIRRLLLLRGFRRGLAAAAVHLKGKFSEYPPKKRPTRASVYGRTFQSIAQRKAVMAKLREEGPYVRGLSGSSETFGRRWAVSERRGGLEQVIGNNASYAPYLVGERQSLYMKAVGWEKLSTKADRERPVLQRIVDREARRDVE